jgi:hypothetical protein
MRLENREDFAHAARRDPRAVKRLAFAVGAP